MRYSPFGKEFFYERRQKLAKLLDPGSVALIFGSHQMPRNGDQFFPYRQNSDFFYLSGIEQEKSILLLAPHAAQKEFREVLFILRPNKTLEIWEGHKLTPDEATGISGIEQVRFLEDFEMLLHAIMLETQTVLINLPELPKFKPDVRSRDYEYLSKLRQDYPLHNFERLAPLLLPLRLIKTPAEIDKIREACAITHQAFLSVLKQCRPGMKEYEIEALITYEFIRHGAAGHAYAPIIAGGANACVLHYIENDGECRDGDLLLMDFGAEYGNYAADLSRTIPVNGKFTNRQREVYEANLRVFEFAKSLMKPGTTINQIHSEVCSRWEEEHIGLGLYSREKADMHTGDSKLWFDYYMHGTSHFIGLDVHDVGNKEIRLEPGMVLSCEPAIYIAAEGLGIRLENDILITGEGHEDLMEGIPIRPEEIESLMNE